MSNNLGANQSIEQMKAEMLGKFDALLRDVASIDAAERDSMISRLAQSLDDAVVEGGLGSGSAGLRRALGETVQSLQQHHLLGAEDSSEVEGEFSQTFSTLQSDGVKRALEFAKIAREEGEEAARKWLSSQASDGTSQTAAPSAEVNARDVIPVQFSHLAGLDR